MQKKGKYKSIKDITNSLNKSHQREEIHVYEFVKADIGLLQNILPFKSKYYSIALLISGNFNIQIDLDDYFLVANDVVLVKADSLVQLIKTRDIDELLVVNFMPEFLSKYQFKNADLNILESLILKTPIQLSLANEDMRILRQLSKQIKTKLNSSNYKYSREIVFHLFMVFLYELKSVAKLKDGFSQSLSRTQDISLRFIKLVKSNCKTNRSVSFYASKLHLTPNHLSDSVKQIFGKSALKIINDITILLLKIELSDLNSSVTQIAVDFSFSSLQHLSQFYKNHTGLSPLQYRERLDS